MKERPILFSAPMVQAILEGRKTQTRRVVKPQPDEDGLAKIKDEFVWQDTNGREYRSSHGAPSDMLWVRETWVHCDGVNYYRADTTPDGDEIRKRYGIKWKPSIFMPRDVCRLFLEVVGVRCERLQEITEDDAEAEGFDTRAHFEHTWNLLNAKRGHPWESNPYVWVVGFRRIEP